jgi:hypothetical protein
MIKKLTLWSPNRELISVETLKIDKNVFECKFTRGRSVERFILEEIGEKECCARNILGQPYGKGLEHCIYMGVAYFPDFTKKVKAFYITTEVDENLLAYRMVQPETIRIDFYGERQEEL